MKRLMIPNSLALLIVGSFTMPAMASCDNVTIANMNVQSAELTAEIDKFILIHGYGCNVDLVAGDTVPSITSMTEKGRPDIAPEAWIDLLPAVVKNGIADGKLVQAASVLAEGGVQGWWIPKYFADAHPEIRSISDVLKHPEWFPAPESSSKGAVFNGPQGWGGTTVTAQFFKGYGFEKAGFELVDTGSAAGLDGSIAKAFARKQGWVGYYWSPTALLGRYPMVKLEGVPHDPAEWARCTTVADCPDPKPNSWSTDHVVTLVTKSFSERSPETMPYLNKRSWTADTASKLMAWTTDNQATGEDAAKYFLKNNEAIWSAWVTPDAAVKIKKAL